MTFYLSCIIIASLIKLKKVKNLIVVTVSAGNGEQAIKNLKRQMQRELVFRSMRMSRQYEPPSVKRTRKMQEADRRRRKTIRKQRMEDEGS